MDRFLDFRVFVLRRRPPLCGEGGGGVGGATFVSFATGVLPVVFFTVILGGGVTRTALGDVNGANVFLISGCFLGVSYGLLSGILLIPHII